jgi:hypothetical protein
MQEFPENFHAADASNLAAIFISSKARRSLALPGSIN